MGLNFMQLRLIEAGDGRGSALWSWGWVGLNFMQLKLGMGGAQLYGAEDGWGSTLCS